MTSEGQDQKKTELLYLNDTYLFESTARVLKLKQDLEQNRETIILDRTIFHPQGGGQPTDTGFIQNDKAKFEVTEVRMRNGIVHHFGHFTEGRFKPNETVALHIDKEKRLLYAKLHSAGHLIDVVVHEIGLNLLPTKGYHFPQGPYVEYAGKIPPEERDELRQKIERRMNERIDQGFNVKVEIVPHDRLEEACGFLPDYVPPGQPTRVVFVAEKLGSPCGGTHVKNIKEIGKVKITKIKVRSGNTRISYSLT